MLHSTHLWAQEMLLAAAQPTEPSSEREPCELLLLISSAAGYERRRKAARESYLSLLAAEASTVGVAVRYRFLLGSPRPEQTEALQAEQAQHGDLLQVSLSHLTRVSQASHVVRTASLLPGHSTQRRSQAKERTSCGQLCPTPFAGRPSSLPATGGRLCHWRAPLPSGLCRLALHCLLLADASAEWPLPSGLCKVGSAK